MSTFCFSPGNQIYKYQLIRKLGEGGFGQVWLAYDATIDQNMAVKIIPAEMAVNISHFRESRIGSHFDHSNLVKIHYADVTQYGGLSFIVIAMDFLPQGSIVSKANSRGFIDLPVAVGYMRNILFGLDHLHHLSFFHNDIKPNNILIGNAGQAVLSDYGVTYTQSDSGTDHVQSYILHRAPETQTQNNVSVLTDIYQCGITAFRLFSDMNYFTNLISRIGRSAYEQLISSGKLITASSFQPYVPTRVRSIILKATSIDPASRYQSAYDMLEDFNKIAFPGYWTANEANQLVGKKRTSDNEFSFEVIPCSKSRFNVNAYVHYPKSGRKNRISDFSGNNLTKHDTEMFVKKFIRHVIER